MPRNTSAQSTLNALALARITLTLELQAWIVLQQRLQVRPARFVHPTEGVQVKRHDLRRMFCQKPFDRGLQRRILDRSRQVLYGSFFMSNLQGVQEIGQYRRVFFEQPGSEQTVGGQFETRPAQ